MSGLPWSKFFWSDYASDPALKLCSFAAQGLWMRMLCIASEHEPPGFVAVNGIGLDAKGIARMTGGTIEEVSELIEEQEKNGVFNRDRRGWIYSRRMINEAKKRRDASEWGKKGGNPNLGKQSDNSGKVKAHAKGSAKGEFKPQKPEARVQKEKRPLVKKEIPIPDDWAPRPFGDGTQSRKIVDGWSRDEHQRQVEAFVAHHRGHGSRWADWQAAWSTWVLNSERFGKPRESRPSAAEPGSFLESIQQRERNEQLKRELEQRRLKVAGGAG